MQATAKVAYLVQGQEMAAAALLHSVLQQCSGWEDVLSMQLAARSMDTVGARYVCMDGLYVSVCNGLLCRKNGWLVALETAMGNLMDHLWHRMLLLLNRPPLLLEIKEDWLSWMGLQGYLL